jgi:hypothetical protein
LPNLLGPELNCRKANRDASAGNGVAFGEDRDRIAVLVGGGEIDAAVVVEVAGGNSAAAGARREHLRPGEPSWL